MSTLVCASAAVIKDIGWGCGFDAQLGNAEVVAP
jgi:hypothetical protein